MRPSEGLAWLEARVGSDPTVAAAWSAFAAFVQIDCDEADVRHGVRMWASNACEADLDLLLFETYQPGDWAGIHLRRQFSWVDETGAYRGMSSVDLDIELPSAARLPEEQFWGRGGPPAAGRDDRTHPEIPNWAGGAEAWCERARHATLMDRALAAPQARWSLEQGDI